MKNKLDKPRLTIKKYGTRAFVGGGAAICRVMRGGRALVELRGGRARDKKLYVRVTECWLNAKWHEIKVNAEESL